MKIMIDFEGGGPTFEVDTWEEVAQLITWLVFEGKSGFRVWVSYPLTSA